ncbi:hypothetical protein IV454_21280 [Massilia antarctica]|uniref:Carboxypeptidase regulatory-like domain-containing protein n=1 Tax=Massilia antarctica TaxID=2765360 RepID=A0AA48WAF4_9BURK|nr:hypothetical protein [Massilia antarctica]QPI48073.1 hypothetical protein IV454_21280 [Massilia antarctica]
MRSHRLRRRGCRFGMVLLLAMLALLQPVRGAATDGPDLVLEVRLGEHLVSDALGAYQHGNDVYLPLGELARMLTIAIRTEPAEGVASGYILDEQRGFRLDLAQRIVIEGERRASVDPALVKRQADDLYVASRLLAKWLPVDLDIDMASLVLRVRAREKLPLQARLERQSRGGSAQRQDSGPAPVFTRLDTPYALAALPFNDQTVALDAHRGGTTVDYSAYLTADLAGMEGALYVNAGKAARGASARLTLARNDPDAGLLGPLRARTLQIGSVLAPGVSDIALASGSGSGLAISNRALGQPMRSDLQTLQGDLPPGWDVELYFNEALIGFQQARPDGRYRFDDQPLIYGSNEFRLVFHGPLGQLRIERHSFLIDQAVLAPGELAYSASILRDEHGGARALLQTEIGLTPQLSASGGVARLLLSGRDKRYANLGVHGYWRALLVDAAVARADDGGKLARIGLKTRIGGMAVGASHARLDGFASELFLPGSDPLRSRAELRLDGLLPGGGPLPMPLSVQLRREQLASGASRNEAGARLSVFSRGTAVSAGALWRATDGVRHADASLQASRRVAGIGVSGHLQWAIVPDPGVTALALAADKFVGDGYLLNAAVTRSFADRQLRWSASLNKGVGKVGVGVSAFYTSRGDYGGGLQLFMALGQEPRSGRWLHDAVPLAASGAASVRIFLDKNRNGIMDGDDEPIKGAGFAVNGGTQLARSDADGVVYLRRLPAHQHVDIAVDPATLEDPQWQAREPGRRLVPRPGKVSRLDIAIGITGAIDGTTYLMSGGGQRGMGDFELELLDTRGTIVGKTTSSADGYYVLDGVAPGDYLLRLAPAQLARLGLQDSGMHLITIDTTGKVVNGKDFHVTK